ncbi:MAG: DUF1330 domain-containing protein [Burkholderiaceae bacterium]
MPKGYWVASYHSIKDPAALKKYAEAAGPVLTSFGARFLARGMPAKVYEDGANERCVVAEFESVEKAIAAYESAAYQAAFALLKDACVREVRIVPGVGEPT